MKDVTSAKGLGELRTATTHHIASKPPRKGTAYLDLYSISMERARLENELSRLEKRQRRLYERLGEIQRAMDKLNEAAQRERMDKSSLAKPAIGQQTAASEQPGRQWKKIAFEY